MQSGKGQSQCKALRLETQSSEKGLHTSQRLRLPCHTRAHAGMLSPTPNAFSALPHDAQLTFSVFTDGDPLQSTKQKLRHRFNSVPRVTERGAEARMGDCGACGLPCRSSAFDSISPAHREKMEASREVSMRALQHVRRPFPASEKLRGMWAEGWAMHTAWPRTPRQCPLTIAHRVPCLKVHLEL